MRTVWKFRFEVADQIRVLMPSGAKILSVANQGGQPVFWAEVDSEAADEVREFRIFGTGHPILGEVGPFVGTFEDLGGRLVWHVYEAVEMPTARIVSQETRRVEE